MYGPPLSRGTIPTSPCWLRRHEHVSSPIGDGLDARRRELAETLPIRRVVQPEDVAALAVHIVWQHGPDLRYLRCSRRTAIPLCPTPVVVRPCLAGRSLARELRLLVHPVQRPAGRRKWAKAPLRDEGAAPRYHRSGRHFARTPQTELRPATTCGRTQDSWVLRRRLAVPQSDLAVATRRASSGPGRAPRPAATRARSTAGSRSPVLRWKRGGAEKYAQGRDFCVDNPHHRLAEATGSPGWLPARLCWAASCMGAYASSAWECFADDPPQSVENPPGSISVTLIRSP